MTFHYFKNYLRYLFCSRHWRGYGVHSPFAFDLVTNVIREELPYYKYSLVEKVRNLYGTSKKSIGVDGTEVAISDLCRGEVSPAMGQLLFRLVNKYKPSNVVSLRLGLGVSAMYLAAPNSELNVMTFEKPSVADYATSFMRKVGFDKVQVEASSASEGLPSLLERMGRLDFLYLNGCETGEELERYVSMCMPKLHGDSVVVVDNIYENESLTAAWRNFQSDEKVRVTVDLFHMGIAFFGETLQKEDYFVRYFPCFHL